MTLNDNRPADHVSYADLPDGSAHGLHGADDVLGTLNRLTDAAVLRGRDAVRQGKVFSLNLPINEPNPALFTRRVAKHSVFETPSGNMDDTLDQFYPQSSSQWDGFLHVSDPEYGFYNGLGVDEHGVHHWAERGITTRGVLLDVSQYMREAGGDEVLSQRFEIDVDMLERARMDAGLAYASGDMLMVNTGWAEWFLGLNQDRRQVVRDTSVFPGLRAVAETFAYLWDNGFCAVVSDVPGLEATPGKKPGTMHQRVLARLGMPLGELWKLGPLASDCAEDRQFDCLVTSAPMNLPGGVGSPANALAVK